MAPHIYTAEFLGISTDIRKGLRPAAVFFDNLADLLHQAARFAQGDGVTCPLFPYN
ncbi:MAG: hypothetical protein ACRD19_08705 [Terriglobia bacterium]